LETVSRWPTTAEPLIVPAEVTLTDAAWAGVETPSATSKPNRAM
jgi:hypothetical protein